MSAILQKPKHNEFDNLFEIIAREGKQLRNMLEEALTDKRSYLYKRDRQWIKPNVIVHRSVNDYLRTLSRVDLKLPVWKIVIPRLDLNDDTVAIYYVAQEHHTKFGQLEPKIISHIFRGTGGYNGTGPHESALAEYYFSIAHISLELRDGDYLLTCMGLE